MKNPNKIDKKDAEIAAIIGKGRKEIEKRSCLLPIIGQGFQVGDLAEVVDQTNTRIALIRLERLSQTSAVLAARVLVGEERCKTLAGFKIMPLRSQESTTLIFGSKKKDSTFFLAPHMIVSQNNLPGMALNKFISPGYTQRGFGLRASGVFPPKPLKILRTSIQGQADLQWSSSSTSPSIDLIKDGTVLGTQKLSTTAMRIKAGARLLSLKGQLWTSAGALLTDSFETKSELGALGGATDKLFKSIRDVKGQGFGLFIEQGAIINGSARFSLHAGFNISQSAETPIVEDGEATNTSEKFKISSTPVIVGATFMVPILDWMYAEINLDYKSISMELPLVNSKVTKAQMETLSFATSLGLRF